MIEKIYMFHVKFCVKVTITWMHGLYDLLVSGGLDRSFLIDEDSELVFRNFWQANHFIGMYGM